MKLGVIVVGLICIAVGSCGRKEENVTSSESRTVRGGGVTTSERRVVDDGFKEPIFEGKQVKVFEGVSFYPQRNAAEETVYVSIPDILEIEQVGISAGSVGFLTNVSYSKALAEIRKRFSEAAPENKLAELRDIRIKAPFARISAQTGIQSSEFIKSSSPKIGVKQILGTSFLNNASGSYQMQLETAGDEFFAAVVSGEKKMTEKFLVETCYEIEGWVARTEQEINADREPTLFTKKKVTRPFCAHMP